MRIALVEDNERLVKVITEALRRAGVTVDAFFTLKEASVAIATFDYRALVIDRGLPDGEGIALLRRLRQDGSSTPCLVLTARDAIHDRIDGLDAGADDYLGKPFALEELVARVKALLRRPQALLPPGLTLGNVSLDTSNGDVAVAGLPLLLPGNEQRLLRTLLEARGRVVSRNALIDAASGPLSAVSPNSLEVAVHRLRRRLDSAGATIAIRSVRGVGYAARPVDASA